MAHHPMMTTITTNTMGIDPLWAAKQQMLLAQAQRQANSVIYDSGLGQNIPNIPPGGASPWMPFPNTPNNQAPYAVNGLPDNPNVGDIQIIAFDGQRWNVQNGRYAAPKPQPQPQLRHVGFSLDEIAEAQDMIEELDGCPA